MNGYIVKRITNSRDFETLNTFVRNQVAGNSSRRNIKRLLVHVASHYGEAVQECLPHLKQLALSLSNELK